MAGDEGLEPTADVVGDLEFRDVWFQYQSREKVGRPFSSIVNPTARQKHVEFDA